MLPASVLRIYCLNIHFCNRLSHLCSSIHPPSHPEKNQTYMQTCADKHKSAQTERQAGRQTHACMCTHTHTPHINKHTHTTQKQTLSHTHTHMHHTNTHTHLLNLQSNNIQFRRATGNVNVFHSVHWGTNKKFTYLFSVWSHPSCFHTISFRAEKEKTT